MKRETCSLSPSFSLEVSLEVTLSLWLSIAATGAETAPPLPCARVLAKRAVSLDSKLTHGESESDIATTQIPKLARRLIDQKRLRAHN